MKMHSRGGVAIPVSEACEAWTSGSLPRMLAAVGSPCHPVDRHHLLQCIVEATYKERKTEGMADTCERIARQHLAELPELRKALDAERPGMPVNVSTFKYLTMLLTEKEAFAEAIKVCEQALSLGYHDGTTGGFEARIEKIRKLAAR